MHIKCVINIKVMIIKDMWYISNLVSLINIGYFNASINVPVIINLNQFRQLVEIVIPQMWIAALLGHISWYTW